MHAAEATLPLAHRSSCFVAFSTLFFGFISFQVVPVMRESQSVDTDLLFLFACLKQLICNSAWELSLTAFILADFLFFPLSLFFFSPFFEWACEHFSANRNTCVMELRCLQARMDFLRSATESGLCNLFQQSNMRALPAVCLTHSLALGWQKGLILAGLNCVGNSKCPSGGYVSPLFHTCKLPYLPSQARKCSPGRDPRAREWFVHIEVKQLEFD